jgi:hypothetical protein
MATQGPRFIEDIPEECRAALESMEEVQRPFPPDLPEHSPPVVFLMEYAASRPSSQSLHVTMSEVDGLLQSAAALQARIKEGHGILSSAELKRREIASSAELIHGECDSQLSSEQKLTMFVKSIDYILQYFENLDRIALDFMSPNFTVLSPDFATILAKIDQGIRFLEMNPNYRESRAYLLRYNSIQQKAIEIVKTHIAKSLQSLVSRIASSLRSGRGESDIYGKFMGLSGELKRLFRMVENLPGFVDVMAPYRDSRLALFQLSLNQHSDPEFKNRVSSFLTTIRKEFELAKEFMNFERPVFQEAFGDLVSAFAGAFCNAETIGVLKLSELKQISEISIVVKATMHDDMPDLPNFLVDRLREHFARLLSLLQERLSLRVELCHRDICSSADRALETISIVHWALSPEAFGEIACGILTTTMANLRKAAGAEYPVKFESELFLLANFLKLKNGLSGLNERIVSQTVGLEPFIDFLKRVLRIEGGFMRVVSVSVDGRQELESGIELLFGSVAGYATQFLRQRLMAETAPAKAEDLRNPESSLCVEFKTTIAGPLSRIVSEEGARDWVVSKLKKFLAKSVKEWNEEFELPDGFLQPGQTS